MNPERTLPRQTLALAVGSIALLPIVLTPSAASADEDSATYGVVADRALAVCLNQHLGQPAPYDQPITEHQLEHFGHADDEHTEDGHADDEHAEDGHSEAEHGGVALRCNKASSGKIADLRGLEHLQGVEIVNLAGNDITDLMPLAGLTSVKELYLSGNRITSTAGINALPALQRVDLSSNALAILEPFTDAASLTSLDISRNQLSDLTPLTTLDALTALVAHNNQVSDLTPIASLDTLVSLSIDSNRIYDLSPLADTRLQTLVATGNQIEDLTPLAGLPLGILHLSDNKVSDITPLGQLADLGLLHLEDNRISDVAPLAGLKNLSMVGLDRNAISDLSPLADVSRGAVITATGQKIGGITAFVPESATTFFSNDVVRDTTAELVALTGARYQTGTDSTPTTVWEGLGADATELYTTFQNGDGTFTGTLTRPVTRAAFNSELVIPGITGFPLAHRVTTTPGFDATHYALLDHTVPAVQIRADGALSGTVDASGTYPLTVAAEDALGNRITGELTLIIDDVSVTSTGTDSPASSTPSSETERGSSTAPTGTSWLATTGAAIDAVLLITALSTTVLGGVLMLLRHLCSRSLRTRARGHSS